MTKALPIKDFPNYYVTDDGNVYSRHDRWNGRITKLKLVTSKKNGYNYITLCDNKKHIGKRVHRLVAEAFIPNPDPEHKTQVNHKNGIKTDNRVQNLEWVSASENQKHSFRFLHRKPTIAWLGKRGKLHPMSKPILQIKNNVIISEYDGLLEAQRITNINHSAISMCCNGKLKTAGGYKWKYK